MTRAASLATGLAPAPVRRPDGRVMVAAVLLWHAVLTACGLGWVYAQSTAVTSACGFDCVPQEEAMIRFLALGVPGLIVSAVASLLMVRRSIAAAGRAARASGQRVLRPDPVHDFWFASGLCVAGAVAAVGGLILLVLITRADVPLSWS